jgi:hypothetical protein
MRPQDGRGVIAEIVALKRYPSLDFDAFPRGYVCGMEGEL